MRWKLLDAGPPATYAIVLAKGDEVMRELGRIVQRAEDRGGLDHRDRRFRARRARLFRLGNQGIQAQSRSRTRSRSCRCSAMSRSRTTSRRCICTRCSANRDGSTVGGHLLEGHVRPTLELTLIEPPAHLRKRKDPETGLALIDLERS